MLDRVCVGIGVNGSLCLHSPFNKAAAAETPHGPVDFVGEIEFEGAFGGEFVVDVLSQFGVEGFFAGTDDVIGGE